MKILCCLDGSNGEHMRHAIKMMSIAGAHVIALMTVVEAGPARVPEPSRPEPRSQPDRQPSWAGADLAEAKAAAAKILEAGLHLLPDSEILVRHGRAEREIVVAAREWGADMIIISPRTGQGDTEPEAPSSIGHVARFVLDYAACPVLLVRALSGEFFQGRIA